MKQGYSISGMTCLGCVTTVQKALLQVPSVTEVQVDLENTEAMVTSKSGIGINEVQEALPNKYVAKEQKIFDLDGKNRNTGIVTTGGSKWRQLWPLFLIFGYLIIAVVLLNYKGWNPKNAMLDFMGLFYIVFSFFKLLDLKGFSQSFQMYDPLAKAMPGYGWIYPFLELALGVLFLTRSKISLALILTIVVLGITTIGVTKTLLQRNKIPCACLGTALKLPMTEATFIENAIMLVMAVWMLAM